MWATASGDHSSGRTPSLHTSQPCSDQIIATLLVVLLDGRFGSTVNPRSAVRNVGFAARFGQKRTVTFAVRLPNSGRLTVDSSSRISKRVD